MQHASRKTGAPHRRGTWPAAAVVAAIVALFSAAALRAAPAVLTTGTDDGSITVDVDGYGSFGAILGVPDGGAVYNPVGSPEPRGIVLASGVAVGMPGTTGGRFLSTAGIGASGNLPDVAQEGGGTGSASQFTAFGLQFSLSQVLQRLPNGQGGPILTQTYNVTNPTARPINGLALTRYLDANVDFDDPTSLDDGGGRLVRGGTELLFQTATATGPADDTTFVAIVAEGGATLPGNRYLVHTSDDVLGAISQNVILNDLVARDGPDADRFVDAGQAYDLSAALTTFFDVPAGGTVSYTTHTYFGDGAPAAVTPIPLPPAAWAGAALMGTAAAAGAARRLRRRLRGHA